MEEPVYKQINFNQPPKKRGWLFGLFFILFLTALFFAGQISNITTVEKSLWWQKIGNIWKPVATDKSQEAELEKLFPMPTKDDNRLNLLILGIRGADDQENGGLLSDSIMLFSFDKTTHKSFLVSIPRDLYIEMPGLTKGKLNEVYEKGVVRKDAKNFTKKTFSRITGVFVDNLAVFDFQAFKDVVGSIDGIDINLKKPFDEKSQWGYEFHLPAGVNHLDGESALYYARSRFSSSDFDRSRRQQEIVFAIKNKILSLGILSNPLKVASLVSGLKNNINTDFNVWDTKDLLRLALTLNSSSDKLKTEAISTDNILYQTIQNSIYVLLPKNNDWGLIRNFFKDL